MPRSEHMLSPAAYDEEMLPTLRLAHTSRLARRIAKFLLVVLVVAVVLMAFVPWQQSVTGSGNVVAYTPLERRQTIDAPIKGRVVRWGDGLIETTLVLKGQFLLEIQDLVWSRKQAAIASDGKVADLAARRARKTEAGI